MLTAIFSFSLFHLFECFVIYLDQTDIRVKTPGYPNRYPPNINQTWVFTHHYGVWSIIIEQFNLELSTNCVKDYLEVTEGATSKKTRYCGEKKTNNLYVSKGKDITLRFVSDGSIQESGFHLEVHHFSTDENIDKKLHELEASKKAARAKVFTDGLGGFNFTLVFYILFGIFSAALLTLIGLLIYCIISSKRDSREVKHGHWNKNIVFQLPALPPKSRRYSRSISRDSGRPGAKLPTRYV